MKYPIIILAFILFVLPAQGMDSPTGDAVAVSPKAANAVRLDLEGIMWVGTGGNKNVGRHETQTPPVLSDASQISDKFVRNSDSLKLSANNGDWNQDTSVYDVLRHLGEPMARHAIRSYDESDVRRGEEIVILGATVGPDGRRSQRQSRYFTCINCHNVHREDPDLASADPVARLDYAIDNRLPFLPATTFYGLVNRTSWFNDDYVKKYGDLTHAANTDLRKAIQLCATECSMGRRLNDWEMQAVLAYFWSLQLKLGDLNLSEQDWSLLRQAAIGQNRSRELLSWLKGLYLDASPATFVDPPKNIAPPSDDPTAIQRGKAIYELGCLNCHKPKEVTFFTFANSQVTYRLLNDHTMYSADFSMYNAIRKGTKASPGKGYMPNFTLQRMSAGQIEALRAFVNYQATNDPLPIDIPRSILSYHEGSAVR